MAIGDDAAAAGMPLVPGSLPANQIDTEFNRTRDFIAGGPANWKPATIVPITKGGTGGATAAEARTALSVPESAGPEAATPGKAPVYNASGRLVTENPANPFEVANKQYVDSVAGGGGDYLPLTGGTLSGHLWVPNSVAANIGVWTAAYINGDGRLSRGASSERFKDDIAAINPMELGDIFPQLHTFVMKDDPGRTPRIGYIAERLNESEALQGFVVHQREAVVEDIVNDVVDDDGTVRQRVVGQRVVGSTRSRDENGNPIPEAIDSISLLIAQVARLHAEVVELRERVQTLEGS